MELERFTLKKVKTINNGGLEVEFSITEYIGASIYNEQKKVTSTKFIHPDLEKALEGFLPFYAQNLGYDLIRKIIHNPEFKATADQKKKADLHYEEALKQLIINGISVAKDENSIKILGKNIINNLPIAMNSNNLRFDTSHGYEEEIKALTDTLKNEVYEYLFKDKVSNPELFGADQ